MALTLDARCDDVMELDEYVEYVERCVDLDDLDSICESAPRFRALLNNKTLISRFVDRELRTWREFQRGNGYVGQTLMLATRPKFAVRANMWLPQRSAAAAAASTFNEYSVAHDHNFVLLTGGYFGSGYGTAIYEYEPSAMRGEPGERVDLQLLEHTTLPEGKIMVYRASSDVHYQKYPQAFSISLNLLVTGKSTETPQYFFDLERGIVTGSVYSAAGETLAICELASYVGGPRTADLLADVAASSPNRYVAAAARRSRDRLIRTLDLGPSSLSR